MAVHPANIIEISGAKSEGQVRINIEGVDIKYDIKLKDGRLPTNKELADGFAAEIIKATKLPAFVIPYKYLSNVESYIVQIKKGSDLNIKIKDDDYKYVVDNLYEFTEKIYDNEVKAWIDTWILSMKYADNSDSTIDIFVLPRGMQINFMDVENPGFAHDIECSNPNSSVYLPGSQNTIFLAEKAADTDDADWPFVAGHEVGHIYFGVGHLDDEGNLMGQFTDISKAQTDRYDSPKRLTSKQGEKARFTSGPGSTNPQLLFKE